MSVLLTLLCAWIIVCLIVACLIFAAPRPATFLVWGSIWLLFAVLCVAFFPLAAVFHAVRQT